MEAERLKILHMVAHGKITPEQGAELLKAVETSDEEPSAPRKGAKWLRVEVTELDTGNRKVNVRMPFFLAKLGLKMGGKAGLKHGEHDLDLSALAQAFEEGLAEENTLVDVTDADKREHVRVWVE